MDKLLIVGCGSIGRRHLTNFRAAGVGYVAGADPNDERRRLATGLGAARTYASCDEALAHESFDAAAICVPPHLHMPLSLAAAKAGCHLFIEKPLAASLDHVDALIDICARQSLAAFVGYSYRFIPSVVKMKEMLDRGAIGRVLSARLCFSSYLPDWHPWEDYRSFYMARKEEGGGALLDESHGLDLLRWLLGEMVVRHATIGHISDLEITSDDLAALVLTTGPGAVVEAHFDLLGRPPRLGLEIVGSTGTIVWDRIRHSLSVYDAGKRCWETYPYTDADYLSMYEREVRHFISCVDAGTPPLVTVEDARKTLALALTAFDTAGAEGRMAAVP